MEEQKISSEKRDQPHNENSWKWIAIFALIFLVITQIYYLGLNSSKSKINPSSIQNNTPSNSEDSYSLSREVELPFAWADIGKKLIDLGVINAQALESLYSAQGGLDPEEKKLISESVKDKIVMTKKNSAYLLNLFWAFGLANKNPILEKGPMQDLQYGGAANFASTGGWTISRGDSMDHYSKHELVKLDNEKQALVEAVSKNIYRPCCGNSTYFPDCNHGMAMLGLIELMAASGVSEQEMYRVALEVNSLWFSDSYRVIDNYLKINGMDLASADPKEILSYNYSSAEGYANILNQVQTPEKKSNNGGGCSV